MRRFTRWPAASHHRRLGIALLSVGVLLLLVRQSSAGRSVVAQVPTPTPGLSTSPAPSNGLDILFLVDQSGSMGGLAYKAQTDPPSDQFGLRFEAVQYALRTLAEYQSALGSNFAFRMAVLSFGDTPELSLDWTDINPSAANWPKQENTLIDQLSASHFGKRNLGNTNFLAAYKEAEQLFGKLPAAAGTHFKAIVVLTDGAPCVPAVFSCTLNGEQANHMNQLVAQSTANFADYKQYVIGIDAHNQFWTRLEPYWTKVVGTRGFARRVKDSTEVGQVFLEILLDLVRTTQAARGGSADADIGQPITFVAGQDTSIVVPPYLESVRFTVFKTQPKPGVQIKGADGSVLRSSAAQVIVSGENSPIEVWKISSPPPGLWTLSALQKLTDVKVYLDLIRVPFKLELLPTAPFRRLPISIQLTLLGPDGKPLPGYADQRYQLAATLTITTPAGKIETLDLAAGSAGTYAGSYTPLDAGRYQLDVAASAQTIDGKPFKVLDQTAAKTVIIPNLSLAVQRDPTSDVLLSQSMTISAQLVDGDGKRQVLPQIAVNATLLNVTDISSGTGKPVASYELVADATGLYSVSVAAESTGQYQLQITARPKSNDANPPAALDQQFLPAFRVRPAHLISLKVISPLPDGAYYLTDGFPPVTPARLKIQVSALNDAGEPAALEKLTGGALPLTLEVAGDKDSPVGEGHITDLAPLAGATGLYEATVSGLSAGQYRLTIQAAADSRLGDSTLFDPRFRKQSLHFTLTTNPALIGMVAALVIGTLLVVGVIAGGVAYQVRLRQHPARGTIELQTESASGLVGDRSTVWRQTLDGQRRNRVVYSFRGVPAGLHQLIVSCPTDLMSGRNEVFVTLTRQGDAKPLLNQVKFARDSEKHLDMLDANDVLYFLVKDKQKY